MKPNEHFATKAVLGTLLLALSRVGSTPLAHAQTLTVLHSFGAGQDGSQPTAGVIRDSAGNFYGTTFGGGAHQAGTIYELSPSGSGWTESVLYSFGATASDGVNPRAGLVRDGKGNLYGTTSLGGASNKGTVFKLSPPGGGGNWTETVLYSFTGGTDGAYPYFGSLVLAGAFLYGTTYEGGDLSCLNAPGCGVVFRVPTSGRTESVLYDFTYNPPANNDGAYPYGGLVRDMAGNLYGVTNGGGASGGGVVFELSPAPHAPWPETLLRTFSDMVPDGVNSLAGLARDASGNLYGTTYGTNGLGGFGLVFKLDAALNETFPHIFTGPPSDGANPMFNVIVDRKDNLYGTTPGGGESGVGTIFEVSGGSSERVLYNFTGGSDGSVPQGTLFRDSAGNLYGTTYAGGTSAGGVVFKFHP